MCVRGRGEESDCMYVREEREVKNEDRAVHVHTVYEQDCEVST